MKLALWLALAGAAGTLSRAGVAVVVGRGPWATAAVNLIGCFLFGLLFTLAEERGRLGPELRAAALIGFLGAFTTFSSYIHDTLRLGGEGRVGLAVLNLVTQNALGIGAYLVGAAIVRASV